MARRPFERLRQAADVKIEGIGHFRAVFARLNPVAMRAHARKKFFYSK
jgi:hypothetical protein